MTLEERKQTVAPTSPTGDSDPRERAVLVAVVRDNQDARQADEYLDEL